MSAPGRGAAGSLGRARAPSARASAVAHTVLSWAAAAGLASLAVYTVATALLVVFRTHSAIPQADEWYSLDLYDRVLRSAGLGDALRLMFEPHNEHRLFFPRLVFFSDYRFFRGSGLLDKGVILLTQGAEAALLAWLAARAGAGPAARVALAAVAVALLFSLQQDENLVWAFQVQFVGVFACASLCCALFAFGLTAEGETSRRRAGRALAAGAFALVFVATFTMANGLLVGPVLVALALLARAGRVAALAAVVAAAAAAAFFAGYHPDAETEGAAGALAHLPRIVAFAAGYLGNFSRFGQASQVALGACGLVLTAAVAAGLALELRRGWSPGRRGAARLALLGVALFVVASALATGLGRSGSGLDQIASSRYATGAACFWAATVANLWSLGRGGARLAARAGAVLAAAVLLEASSAGQADRAAEMDRRAAQYGAMEDAMLLGLSDAPALEVFQEPVEQARAMEPVMRRLHLSIFASRDAALLGRPLAEATEPQPPGAPPLACAGTFASARAVPALGQGGVAVAGTSSLRSRSGRPGRVYLVDGGGLIVGFAHASARDGRWAGYARAAPGEALAAWAVSDAGRLCRLGGAVVAEGS